MVVHIVVSLCFDIAAQCLAHQRCVVVKKTGCVVVAIREAGSVCLCRIVNESLRRENSMESSGVELLSAVDSHFGEASVRFERRQIGRGESVATVCDVV